MRKRIHCRAELPPFRTLICIRMLAKQKILGKTSRRKSRLKRGYYREILPQKLFRTSSFSFSFASRHVLARPAKAVSAALTQRHFLANVRRQLMMIKKALSAITRQLEVYFYGFLLPFKKLRQPRKYKFRCTNSQRLGGCCYSRKKEYSITLYCRRWSAAF